MIPLKISQISKTFNKTVLDEINFTVNKGEIFGFIGLNGQGKTTLIKIILDLLDQDNGDVEIFGVSKILPNSRQKICYLPEKFQPAIHQTGFEFLEFALGFYNLKSSINSSKNSLNKLSKHDLKSVCSNLDLDPQALDQKISKYSKGMMQKLGLLATFLSNADLIILDEPMSGLDPKARIALKKELLNYKKHHKTIFFSSHILADMDEICDQIAVLHDSKIRFTGSPKEFKDKHQKNDLDQAFLAEILA